MFAIKISFIHGSIGHDSLSTVPGLWLKTENTLFSPKNTTFFKVYSYQYLSVNRSGKHISRIIKVIIQDREK